MTQTIRSENRRISTINKPMTRECDRCGETIIAYCPTLSTLSQLGMIGNDGVELSDKDAVFLVVSKLEKVSRDDFDEYAFHQMYEQCEENVGICPHCTGRLRTWRAKQCPHCLKSWRE